MTVVTCPDRRKCPAPNLVVCSCARASAGNDGAVGARALALYRAPRVPAERQVAKQHRPAPEAVQHQSRADIPENGLSGESLAEENTVELKVSDPE